MKKSDLKVKAVKLYAELRDLGVSHSLAFAACIEMIIGSVAEVDASATLEEAIKPLGGIE